MRALAPALGLLAALGLVPPTSLAAPEAVRLRYGVRDRATDYWLRETTVRKVRDASGEVGEERADVLSLLTRFVYPSVEGSLMVAADELAREDVVQERSLDEAGLETWLYRISPRGELLPPLDAGADSAETQDLEEGFLPVLPAEPVAPGARWRGRLEAGRALPFAVPLVHRFAGVDTIQGTRCALIETQGAHKGAHGSSKARFSVRLFQGAALSLEDGSLVKLATLVRMRVAPDGTGSRRRIAFQRSRVLQRRQDGDVPPTPEEAPPDSPESGFLEPEPGDP